jgi:hypothetical protein
MCAARRTGLRQRGAGGALLVAALLCHGRTARAEPGDELTISVLTMGPGDHPFFKFGHDAILVHDASRHGAAADRVYNYGTFRFDSPWLLVDFMQGRLRYWLSVQSLPGTIATYQAENRSIDQQTLALTPAERRDVAAFLEWNAAPEHRYYTYDYYRDNCTTRIRDVVDRVTSGRLAAAAKTPAALDLREHTLRLTADDLPVYLGLDLALGGYVDRPITAWEEMFLPEKLEESLRRVTIPGPRGDAPLVASEVRLVATRGRAPERAAPPRWVPRFLGAGTLLGAALALAGRGAAQSTALRVTLGVALSFLGLVVGLLGNLLLVFWLLTDHRVAHRNENILQCAPFVLALAGLGLGVAWGSDGARRVAFRVAVSAAALSLLGVGIKALPWFDQSNGQIVALMLPLWVGTALSLRPVATTPPARP